MPGETTKKELANKNLHADNEFCVLACIQKLVDRNTEVESQNHEDEEHLNSLTFYLRRHVKTLRGNRG